MRLVLVLLFSLLLALPAAAKTNLRPGIYSGDSVPIRTFPIPWGFSCTFPKDPKLRTQVREGFAYVDSLVPRRLFREVPGCGQPTPSHGIMVIPVHQLYRFDGEDVEGTAYVYPLRGQQVGGAIALWQDWFDEEYPDTRRSIVRHEILHVLGFEHNLETESCLMHPYINTDRFHYHGHEKNVCESELRELRRLYGKVGK